MKKAKQKKTKKDLLGTLRIPTPPPGHHHGDKKKYDRKSSKKDAKHVIIEGETK